MNITEKKLSTLFENAFREFFAEKAIDELIDVLEELKKYNYSIVLTNAPCHKKAKKIRLGINGLNGNNPMLHEVFTLRKHAHLEGQDFETTAYLRELETIIDTYFPGILNVKIEYLDFDLQLYYIISIDDHAIKIWYESNNCLFNHRIKQYIKSVMPGKNK